MIASSILDLYLCCSYVPSCVVAIFSMHTRRSIHEMDTQSHTNEPLFCSYIDLTHSRPSLFILYPT
jgi:hypothetical protein